MKIIEIDLYSKIVLTIGVALLGVIAVRPLIQPVPVAAQSEQPNLFVEPATTIIRTVDGRAQMQGKVVVDMRTGDVYGFPTDSSAPYPVLASSHEPPVSKPVYLGKFDFSAMAAAKRAAQKP